MSVISKDMSRYRLAFYTILHPGAGFDELRYRKKNSLRMSLLFFILLVFSAILEQQLTGSQIVMTDPNSVNLPLTLGTRLVLVVLFAVSNWAFSVLVDGKATLIDVWIVSLYSLQPYIYCSVLRVIMSNILTEQEGAYLTFIMILGILWSLILLITALMTFHEFELGKAVFSLIVTVIGMLLIVFLVFLIYSLFSQLMSVIMTVFNEVYFRTKMD